ncbi:MAG TPA: flagellar hook-basal body complex protein FliE [Terriglobales bacterium]|nr:flagellar hook-basal body complex protein FliE [Terriglobales bacterium]
MNNTIIPAIGGLPTMPSAPTAPLGGGSDPGGFGETLRNAIHSVDQLNQTSDSQVSELLKGDRQDIHNVMIAVEKADVSFQLMMQVRNKILNAYQEVSKLQF